MVNLAYMIDAQRAVKVAESAYNAGRKAWWEWDSCLFALGVAKKAAAQAVSLTAELEPGNAWRVRAVNMRKAVTVALRDARNEAAIDGFMVSA